MKRILALLITLFTVTSGAIAQGSPDIFWDDSHAWGPGIRNFSCRMGIAPSAPQAFLFMEWLPLATGQPSPYRLRLTTISPAGVRVHDEMNGSISAQEYGLISRTGQMVVYMDYATHPTPRYMMSTDYGQTFLPVTLPTSATYTTFGVNGVDSFGAKNNEVYNSVIAQDDKFYAFYYTTRPGSSSSTNRYELNMVAIDINRNQTHTVIDQISGSSASLGNNSYINVVSTNSELVAVVRPGRVFRPRGGTTTYQNVPMAVVYDFTTQNISKINFGGTLGSTYENNYRSGLQGNFTDGNARMLSTDGENIFMLTGSAPTPGGRAPLRLREFIKSPGNTAGFFINTEANQPTYIPSWEPYMDLESAAMDYGTYDTSFVGSTLAFSGIGAGTVMDFTSKWAVGGVADHSADVYFESDAEQIAGLTSVRRMRISNPNSPTATLTEETVEDFPIPVVASIFGPPTSNYRIPNYLNGAGARSHLGIDGAVVSTFCYSANIPPLNFLFHLTDIS